MISNDKILTWIFILIAGWAMGYMHHYMATRDIYESRQELSIMRNVAVDDMHRYAGLVRYAEDDILRRASELADEILLEGGKSIEFHQLCKEIRRAQPKGKGGM